MVGVIDLGVRRDCGLGRVETASLLALGTALGGRLRHAGWTLPRRRDGFLQYAGAVADENIYFANPNFEARACRQLSHGASVQCGAKVTHQVPDGKGIGNCA